jgi:hypothetical protein
VGFRDAPKSDPAADQTHPKASSTNEGQPTRLLENFKPLPDLAKRLLALGMILDRLVFMAVLVLFIARSWRS